MWYVVWIIVGVTFPRFKFSGNSTGNRFPVQKESISVFYFIFDDWNTVMKLIFYDNSFNRILNFLGFLVNNKWGVVFKNGPSKICGRQSLKIWIDIVCKGCLPLILLSPFLNTLTHLSNFFAAYFSYVNPLMTNISIT